MLDNVVAPISEESAESSVSLDENRSGGYVDFYGYHSASGGWVFLGWIDLAPATGDRFEAYKVIPAAWTDDSPVNWSGSAGCDSQSPL